jgi:glycosyltransferase involved in cell wall biosynthesis
MQLHPQSLPTIVPEMRLCMDARMLVTAGGTGVSSYARQLRDAHAVITERRALLVDRLTLDGPPPAPLGRPGRWLRALWGGAREARALHGDQGEARLFAADVFRLAQVYFDVHRRPMPVRLPGPPGIMHWTYPVPMTVMGWRNLYTVHDVIPLLHPQLTDINAPRYRRLLDRLRQSAAGFIAVSETARSEIIQTLGCDPSFVIDCGLAVETSPVSASLPAGVEPGAFLLVCGTVERRKNIAAILTAYRLSGVTAPLVIAGPDGWGVEEVNAQIAATPGVIRLPYLDRPTMLTLISRARALVMPSLAEGFGMPVAEAMASGVPVITANQGALAETAGGAALLVDPADIQQLADAIAVICSDPILHAKLSGAGRRNAQRFTPARFAERLTQAYGAVMAEQP